MGKKGQIRALAGLVAALASLTVSVPAAGAAGVLVVGDSLEELTSPYLPHYLPGVKLTVNAEGGYNSFQIYDLFQESYDPSQSVIVFDAGTNDNPAYPEILAGNLGKVAATVGDRCMVVPTIHGYTVNGIDNTGKNRVVEEFAASRPGTQVPDWGAFEESHPELMQSDDLHPTEEGASYRAQLIAQGILGCLDEGAASTSQAPAGPALKERPDPIAAPRRLARRQSEALRSIAAEVLMATLLRAAVR